MNWDKVKKAIGINQASRKVIEETRRAALEQEKQEATKKGESGCSIRHTS